MTFLEPALLLALPLAALPVLIHLIHLYRRRQVKWAAMMFLRMAQRMNKGLSRLRQVLILAFRVLAVAAIIFVITRPLAGGWLGLTGGAPDTVLILVDRSASMQQQNPATGVTKREAGLKNISRAIHDAVGTRSRLVLLDSATDTAQPLDRAERLLDLPQTGPTDTRADVPGLLQRALDYISTNKTGRTDVWLLSDLQQGDWDAGGGRWEALRSGFSSLKGVRFHLLTYPEQVEDDLAIRVDRVLRRETADKAELLLDLRIFRPAGPVPAPMELPLRVVINGAATTMNVTLKESQVVLQGQTLPIDKSLKRGWGRVELPGDACLPNNTWHFVFDEPPALRSAIVSDDENEAAGLAAALGAAADPQRRYAVTRLPVSRAVEIPWEDTALVVWHAPLPKPGEALAEQLEHHVAQGRTVFFLPPEAADDTRLFGLGWGRWQGGAGTSSASVEWWRNDADVLANLRDGMALPVGEVSVTRRCEVVGEGIPLARVEGREPLMLRSAGQGGAVYFLGTLTGPGTSSLARDGVVMFAMLHRTLNEAGRTLGRARQLEAAPGALPQTREPWVQTEGAGAEANSLNLALLGGVRQSGEMLAALNRPPGEDEPVRISETTIGELFAGLDHRLLKDTLEDGRSLTNEIWRTFLLVMAIALVAEALLCMPGRPEPGREPGGRAFSATGESPLRRETASQTTA